MGFKKFAIYLAIRTVLLMLTLIVLTFFLTLKGYFASILLVTILLIIQCVLGYRFVNKTNNELTRFFDSARYADYSQRFEFSGVGAGFSDLGETFTEILKRFHENRTSQEQQHKHLKAVIEHIPVPLISLQFDGKINLWNNSARRLFGSNKVTLIDDLFQFGEDFHHTLKVVEPGEKKLVIMSVDGMEHQLVVMATQIIIASKQEKLLSLQDIQTELDRVQLQAWQDLVRVLTHEIMNSITPVASLAKTAVDLLDDAQSKLVEVGDIPEELIDASDAVNTVSRRSDGLINFVGSYRQLAKLPKPEKRLVKIKTIISQVITIATQTWNERNIQLVVNIEPAELEINVDVGMVEQIMINLFKNAEQALQSIENAKVEIKVNLNRRGHIVFDLFDNGNGISKEISEKIFVPFFTTKRDGSGVGLALTRQVMIAHHGSVKLLQSPLGGAMFRLTF